MLIHLKQKEPSISTYLLVVLKKNSGISQIMEPIVEELSVRFENRLHFFKELESECTIEHKKSVGIISPTFFYVKNDKLVGITYGLLSHQNLNQFIENHLGS